MFKYAETVPPIYPARTAVTQSTVGPVVWTETVVSKATVMVAFNAIEFWELVRTGLPLLTDSQRDDLVTLCGGVRRGDYDELVEQLRDAEEEASAARADLDVLAENIARRVAADVIDLDKERAKRRPAPKTPAAA